jgi:hypothetical protein
MIRFDVSCSLSQFAVETLESSHPEQLPGIRMVQRHCKQCRSQEAENMPDWNLKCRDTAFARHSMAGYGPVFSGSWPNSFGASFLPKSSAALLSIHFNFQSVHFFSQTVSTFFNYQSVDLVLSL